MKIACMKVLVVAYLTSIGLHLCGCSSLPQRAAASTPSSSRYANDPIHGGCGRYQRSSTTQDGKVLFVLQENVAGSFCEPFVPLGAPASCVAVESTHLYRIANLDDKDCDDSPATTQK